MTTAVLFNWVENLIKVLGVTALAMAFMYMYATESKKNN
jgi:hypothetical protein